MKAKQIVILLAIGVCVIILVKFGTTVETRTQTHVAESRGGLLAELMGGAGMLFI